MTMTTLYKRIILILMTGATILLITSLLSAAQAASTISKKSVVQKEKSGVRALPSQPREAREPRQQD